MAKGLVAFDCLIFALIVCTMAAALVAYCAQAALQEKYYADEREKMLFLQGASASLLGRRNENATELGSAFYNSEKKRIEQNVLDESLLLRARPRTIGNFLLASIYEKNGSTKKYYFSMPENNCMALERAAIVKNMLERKTLIGVVLCER